MNILRFGLIAVAMTLIPGLSGTSNAALIDVVGVDPAKTLGNNNWQGTLGMTFTATRNTRVTALGAFTGGQGIAFTSSKPIIVTLYNVNTFASPVALASYNFNPGDVTSFKYGSGSSIFQTLATPVALSAGSTYEIVAYGYGYGLKNGNLGGGFPASSFPAAEQVTFLKSYYGDPNTGLINTHLDGSPAARYAAGTFLLAPVPEPSTWALMIVGGIALAAYQSRRRKASPSLSVPGLTLAS